MTHNTTRDDEFQKMEIGELVKEKRNICNKIWEYENILSTLRRENIRIQDFMAKTCNHDWKRDMTDSYNEHAVYMCKVCGISNGYYDGKYYHP